MNYGTPKYVSSGANVEPSQDAWTESTTGWSNATYSLNADKVIGNWSIQVQENVGFGSFKYDFPAAIDVSLTSSFVMWTKNITKSFNTSWIFFHEDAGKYFQYEVDANIFPADWSKQSFTLASFTQVGEASWTNITYMVISGTFGNPYWRGLIDKMYFSTGTVSYGTPTYGTPAY